MSKHRTKSAPAAGGAGVKGSKSKKPLAVEFESKEKSDGGGPVIPEKEESVKSKSFIYEAPPLPLHPPVTPVSAASPFLIQDIMYYSASGSIYLS